MTVRQFVPCVPHPNQGLVIAAYGEEKVGKTHFGFTFPEPIYMFNFDFGWDAAIRSFEGKDIRRTDYFLGEHATPAEWTKLMTDFEDTYKDACEHVGSGTIMVDTATQLDQIVQSVTLTQARESRTSGKGLIADYQFRNRMMDGILHRPYLYPEANAVFLHRIKEAYDSEGKPTGRMVMHCFGATPAIVQATVEITYRNKTGGYRFSSCRQDRALEGQSFPDPSYESLKVMLS